MFIIRQAQIDALIKGTNEEFETFLMEHAREEFPEKTAERDDETLRTMVRNGIRRAEKYGFTKAEDQTAFISIMFEIGPNFDEQKDINGVLTNPLFDAAIRYEQLWSSAVPDEAWDEAAKDADEQAWFTV